MLVYVFALSSKSRTRVVVLTRNGLLKASAAVIAPVDTPPVIPIAIRLALAALKRDVAVPLGQTTDVTPPATRVVQTLKLLVMRTPFVATAPCGRFTVTTPSGFA